MSDQHSQLLNQLNFESKFTRECEWGTTRYESNPWCSPEANVLHTTFNYKVSAGKYRSTHQERYKYNSLQINSILFVYNSSTPEDPLFRLYTIHLDNFKFSVYRQLNLDIPPTLVGHYSSYTNALKVCTQSA
jgi:hypothetical protein